MDKVKFFKDSRPQILLALFLNTLTEMVVLRRVFLQNISVEWGKKWCFEEKEKTLVLKYSILGFFQRDVKKVLLESSKIKFANQNNLLFWFCCSFTISSLFFFSIKNLKKLIKANLKAKLKAKCRAQVWSSSQKWKVVILSSIFHDWYVVLIECVSVTKPVGN